MQDESLQQITKSNLINDLNNPKQKIDPKTLNVPSSASINESQLTTSSTGPIEKSKAGESSIPRLPMIKLKTH